MQPYIHAFANVYISLQIYIYIYVSCCIYFHAYLSPFNASIYAVYMHIYMSILACIWSHPISLLLLHLGESPTNLRELQLNCQMQAQHWPDITALGISILSWSTSVIEQGR